ncbi:MAG: Uma2 family endonuclease [Saprospiraceae bacterium]
MVASATGSVIEREKDQKISWETFQRKYLTREDRYKYEWVDGTVEKTLRSMDKTQFYFQRLFNKFLHSLKFNGEFIAEGDAFFAGNHRRPDLALYTDEQLVAGKQNQDIVPDFVIEIISTNDQINKVNKKMIDYRAANVKVIWHVFPETKEIHVYHGKKMQICTGQDPCSAEPVVKGFVMKAEDVFK